MKKTPSIDLNDLMDAIDLRSEFLSFFVDLSSGEIVALLEEEKKGIHPNLFHEITIEVDKPKMMEEFCLTLEEEDLKNLLLGYLQGEDGVDQFLFAVQVNQLEDLWLQYMEERLKNTAISWCKEKGLSYVDRPREEDSFDEDFDDL